jgi:ABC-type hemin transport system substrate-binding protein
MVDIKQVVRMINYSISLAVAAVIVVARVFAGITGSRRVIVRTAASRTRIIVGMGGEREIHGVTTSAIPLAIIELVHLIKRTDENKSLIR